MNEVQIKEVAKFISRINGCKINVAYNAITTASKKSGYNALFGVAAPECRFQGVAGEDVVRTWLFLIPDNPRIGTVIDVTGVAQGLNADCEEHHQHIARDIIGHVAHKENCSQAVIVRQRIRDIAHVDRQEYESTLGVWIVDEL